MYVAKVTRQVCSGGEMVGVEAKFTLYNVLHMSWTGMTGQGDAGSLPTFL